MSKLNRQDSKEQERQILVTAAEAHPELFEQHSYVEGDALLREFGITIPGKASFSEGYLKLWPADFIVEEVGSDGTVYTVTRENVLTEETALTYAPTTFATLVKCGLSTIEVVEDLAKQLECDRQSIGYAGIKDRDALTAQRISFRKISPQKLKKITSPYFFLKDVTTGNGAITTGGLKGNRFTLLIRTPNSFFHKDTFDTFAKQLATVREQGFSNFFYLQRFGTPRLHNYVWGLSILRGEYEQTVLDVLAFGAERELPYFKNLRIQCQQAFGDWKAVETILASFPIIFRHELKMVRYLIDHPSDYSGALGQISDQIVLWVYALASRYFNQAISASGQAGGPLPQTLPLFLSYNKKSWAPYEAELRHDGIFPPPFENLKPFPALQMRDRSLPTTDRPAILWIEAVDQGLVLSFELGKGQYATTFLSHLFNLVSGKPPAYLDTAEVDTKAVLEQGTLRDTIAYFAPIIRSKVEAAADTEE
ncbi:MAG: tRNA pseudouridine(13) synthase TruD [Candidatus Moranbacteria bacterium]|nr:tRNA pseudouridine(13) synthase TruD [Candidatus Moranbacteria bacterium]